MENETAVEIRGSQGASMSLSQVTQRVNLVHEILTKVMVKGTHYGTVPGCGSKMVLLKPGADLLAMTFRLVPTYDVSRNDTEEGHREYDVTCSMKSASGDLLGQGVGSASTMERKYRYRWEGEGNNKHKIENEDIADCYNTVLKIAKKRAHIDATLTVTGAADLFMQDLIDEDEPAKEPVKMPVAKDAPAKETKEAPAGKFITGTLSDIKETHGKKKDGTEWTKYGLVVGDSVYGTFSDTIAEDARAIFGQEVTLEYVDDGKYKNCLSIALLG